MPMAYTAEFYRALHNMYGSDHRPVQLGLTLKDFHYPDFADFNNLLDISKPRQGYGEIEIEYVKISDFAFMKCMIL